MARLILCGLLLVAAFASANAACGCTSTGKRGLDDQLVGAPVEDESLLKTDSSSRKDGDMILTKEDQLVFKGFRASISESRKWPNGEIPYEMSRLNGDGQRRVRAALAALTKATDNCVKFREVRNPSGGYASVFSGGGCYSYVGKIGRKQDVSLGRGCLGTETIQHEFMHALGFYHEQNRADRDRFVTIHWNNIISKYCHAFTTCRGCKMTTPYDIKSIMQYQGNAFSCNGKDTMVDKSSGRAPRRNMRLTQNDIKQIKDYYKCK